MFIQVPVLWLVDQPEEELSNKVLADLGVKTPEEDVEEGFSVLNVNHIKSFNDSGKRKGVTAVWMVGDGGACFYVNMSYSKFKLLIGSVYGGIVE